MRQQSMGLSMNAIVRALTDYEGYWDTSRNVPIWQMSGAIDDVSYNNFIKVDKATFGRPTPPHLYTDYWSREQHMLVDVGIKMDVALMTGEGVFYIGFGKSDVMRPFDHVLKAIYAYPDVDQAGSPIGPPFDADGLPCVWLYPHVALYFSADFSVYLSIGNGTTQKRILVPGADWRSMMGTTKPPAHVPVAIDYYPGERVEVYWNGTLALVQQYDVDMFPSGDIVADPAVLLANETDIANCLLIMRSGVGWVANNSDAFWIFDYMFFVKSV
jgi:hypothetical protein